MTIGCPLYPASNERIKLFQCSFSWFPPFQSDAIIATLPRIWVSCSSFYAAGHPHRYLFISFSSAPASYRYSFSHNLELSAPPLLWWGCKVLLSLSALNGAEALLADIEDLVILAQGSMPLSGVTYSIDALQESIAENVEGHSATALDATVHHVVACISKSQILLVDGE